MPTRRAVALASCLLVTGLAACSGEAAPQGEAPPTKTPAPPATVSMATPKGGVDPVLATQFVAFGAKGGEVTDVRVERADGTPLPASVAPDGTLARWSKTPQAWRLSGVLAPKTAYRATVTGRNADGVEARRTFAFTTNDAPRVQTRVNPGDDQVVGVGMPIQLRFSRAVPDKAALERHLSIKTVPPVTGSWGWADDETALWRPKTFWPAGTKVSAAIDVADHHLGKGLFGGTKRTVAFTVGRDLRMTVNDDTHEMTVTQAGKTVGTFPVSLGKPGHTTRSGTKIVYEKHTPYTMRGEAADPYVTTVTHAQRITDSGEFLHAAPWSVGDQGRRNVSHGCTNLSPSAAAWLYSRTLIGDPVVTTGTGRKAETWNGLGGIWNFTYAQWQARSAL